MSCCVCQKSKTSLTCGLCNQDLCKPCAEFIEPESISFLKTTPEVLKHSILCTACYTESALPLLNAYDATMKKAQQILVFEKTQSKETRLLKRKEQILTVPECADRNETILRLAFYAAELGFNSIIDVDLKPKKIRNGTYQHTLWSGTAMPAQVSDNKLVKDRSIWSNPN